ncbi:MAG: ABC transporter substrate-binding protein, partial [Vicinamibacteria bacterium]
MTRKLELSIAVGPYDRTRALIDGEVRIDGVDPIVMTFTPEEMFFRAFRHAEFDVCELSMSSQTVKVARHENAYVGVPVFPSRAFRHTSIYVRRDRIGRPEDLKGKRIGVPEYQLTANVWARAILADDHGIMPSDVTWVQGGIDEPGRPEKIALKLPASIRVEAAPADDTISAMLDRGDLDGYIGPRPPS